MLKTERLTLRQWTSDDLAAFAKISGDLEVMEFYPKPLTEEESYALGRRIQSLIKQRGWGFGL